MPSLYRMGVAEGLHVLDVIGVSSMIIAFVSRGAAVLLLVVLMVMFCNALERVSMAGV